jgi:RNA polymerase sigma-70 factor (ECF subfamily)
MQNCTGVVQQPGATAHSQSSLVTSIMNTNNAVINDVKALIIRVQQRDLDAHRQLFLKYQSRVHACALQLLRCNYAADDIVQEVFERIWRYAPSFKPDGGWHPEAWIFQIARNQSMTELSRRKRFDEYNPDDADAEHAGQALSHPFNTEPLVEQIRPDDLARAQDTLPANYRQVLHLRFNHDLSNPEIAEHLGIPVGTAKTWLRRSLISMRCELSQAAA